MKKEDLLILKASLATAEVSAGGCGKGWLTNIFWKFYILYIFYMSLKFWNYLCSVQNGILSLNLKLAILSFVICLCLCFSSPPLAIVLFNSLILEFYHTLISSRTFFVSCMYLPNYKYLRIFMYVTKPVNLF